MRTRTHRLRTRAVVTAAATFAAGIGSFAGGAPAAQSLDLTCPQSVNASHTTSGGFSSGTADRPTISPDGKFVAFDSRAADLVPGVTAATRNVFLENVTSGQVRSVSYAVSGQPDGISTLATVSDDGRYVAFVSEATNLGPGPGYESGNDVFLRDMTTGAISLVSVSPTGGPANEESVGPANQTSTRPAMTGDGRYIAFNSNASNLVAGDDNNDNDIFVRDTVNGITTLVNRAAGGGFSQGRAYRPEISADGRYVAFVSNATDLVPGFGIAGKDQVYVRDLVANVTQLVSITYNGKTPTTSANRPSISADGRYIAFQSAAFNITADDQNGLQDVFVRDMQTGVTTLASRAWDGSQGNDESVRPRVTDDGTKIVFDSFAKNLVPDDHNFKRDTFVRDLADNTTTRVTVSTTCGDADGASWRPEIDGAGTIVAYLSDATNLVAGDDNGHDDVFTVRLTPPPPDDTAPTAAATSPTNGEIRTTSSTTFSGTASDNVAIAGVAVGVHDIGNDQWLQPDGTWSPSPATLDATLTNPGSFSTPWSLTRTLPNGSFEYEVHARDTSGNVDPDPHTTPFFVDVDVAPPTETSLSPTAGSSVPGPSVTISGNALDNRGVAKVELTVKNRATGQYLRPDGTFQASSIKVTATLDSPGATSSTWSFAASLPAGNYQYGVITTDTGGLKDADKHYTNFTVT